MRSAVRFKRVGIFLLLTFGLTWGFEALVASSIGQPAYLSTGLHPLGMFFPALSALLIELCGNKDRPRHWKNLPNALRWIYLSFMLLVLVYATITGLALTTALRPLILQGIGAILVMQWTLLLFYLSGKIDPAELHHAGLSLGNRDLGVRLIAGVALFLLSQAALNWAAGLGACPGIQDTLAGIPIPQSIYPLGLLAFFLILLIGMPLAALAVVFGEEYGWRGFLQAELLPLGNRWAAGLVGLIWGVWHFPIILSGVHTYPPDWRGLGLGLIFFTLVGFIFSYALLKTGSIWVPVFMHGVLNSLYPFILDYLYRPADMLVSFGLGVYGLLCLAVLVGLLLRDPIWQQFNQPEAGR